jgi:HSP20 family protein
VRWELETSWPGLSIEEIERRFDELIRGRWGPLSPPADVFVEESCLWVEVDLPGVERGDVRVRAEGGTLWIEAVRRSQPPSQSARPARVERSQGMLRRAVTLPPGVRVGPAEITLEGGVLRVCLRIEQAR